MGYTSGIDSTSSQAPSVIGVSMKPGTIAFSRMPAPIQSAVVACRRTHRESASFDTG